MAFTGTNGYNRTRPFFSQSRQDDAWRLARGVRIPEHGTVGEGRTGPDERRMTVAQAADALGISAEAVRGRIRRGTIPVEREAGAVYVLMDTSTTDDQPSTTGEQPTDRSELVELLRAQVEDLRTERDAWRDQARRSDYMASAHFERTRELEGRLRELEAAGPPEPAEAPETVEEEPERASRAPIG